MSGERLMDLDAAVRRFVEPGMGIHLAYTCARPNAATFELVRRFAGSDPGFTISGGGFVASQAPLISSGIARRLIASFVGDNYPTAGPNPIFQDAIADGRVEVEHWSLWTIVARLVAGALGVPFLPVNSLAGSSMAEADGFASVDDPFGGAPVGVVRALRPDIVLVHAVAADPDGNLLLSPPYGEGAWGALAARRGVIATVERVIGHDEAAASQACLRVPGHAVLAVCRAPLGSHPYSLYGPAGHPGYVEDEPFILAQREACRSPERLAAWTREWIHDVDGHAGYLRKLGGARVQRLIGAAARDAWELEDPPPAPPGDRWSVEEALVVEAARRLQLRIRDGGHRLLMAGIGYANLAAWRAAEDLRAAGTRVELMAEIGMYGHEPRPGDPFIFSNRTLPTCRVLTDVMGILGTLIGGDHDRGRCLAALGAGQIDRTGAVNSTRTASGRFLVGSGGANDIASAAGELLVALKLGRGRLSAELPYRTSPGDRVRTVVAMPAVLEKPPGEDELVLTGVLPGDGEDVAGCVRRVRELCEWDLRVAREVECLEPPTPHELDGIRIFDPRRVFLGPAPAPGGALVNQTVGR